MAASKLINVFQIPVGDGRTTREIVLLEFDRDVTSEEAIAEAEKQGLVCPTEEDVRYFLVEHTDVRRKRSLVFLFEPRSAPHRDPNYDILWSYDLYGEPIPFWSWSDNRWPSYFWFAFVRK